MSSKVSQAIDDELIDGIVGKHADKLLAAYKECQPGSFVSVEVLVDRLCHPMSIKRLSIGHSTKEEIAAFTDDIEGVIGAFALARSCGDRAAFWAVRDNTRGTLMVRSIGEGSEPRRVSGNRPPSRRLRHAL